MRKWDIVRKIDGVTVASVEADALIESVLNGVTRQIFIGDTNAEMLQLVIDDGEYQLVPYHAPEPELPK